MRGQRAGDLFGRGADIDEQRETVGNKRRRRAPDGFLLFGGDETARLIGEVLDPGGNDGAAI